MMKGRVPSSIALTNAQIKHWSQVYVDCNVPADTVAVGTELKQEFHRRLGQGYVMYHPDDIGKTLVNLRRRAAIPTIRGKKGPSIGSGGGHNPR